MQPVIRHLDHPRRDALGARGASWTAPVRGEAGRPLGKAGIGRSFDMNRIAARDGRFAQQEQYGRGAGMGRGGRAP